nr:EamA family transporter RarD [Actinomycetales bacterium]
MQHLRALGTGASAYVLWGLFPLYFRLLADSGPVEIVAYRALWALLFCLAALAVIGRWHSFTAVLRDRRLFATLALAGFLVALNWGIYVLGVTTDRTLDASMGYFMNPLVSALLGVLILGERLRPAQWLAFGFGATAVAVLVASFGEFPWIAVTLAISFGFYGLVKKRVGGRVGALEGLTAETLALLLPAIAVISWLLGTGAATVQPFSGYGGLVALAGPITAVPLILFAYAAARLNLSTIGMLQYTTPIMLFLLGWLAYGEPMPPERWAGFVLIWIAVVIFAVDAARATRAPRLSRR